MGSTASYSFAHGTQLDATDISFVWLSVLR